MICRIADTKMNSRQTVNDINGRAIESNPGLTLACVPKMNPGWLGGLMTEREQDNSG